MRRRHLCGRRQVALRWPRRVHPGRHSWLPVDKARRAGGVRQARRVHTFGGGWCRPSRPGQTNGGCTAEVCRRGRAPGDGPARTNEALHSSCRTRRDGCSPCGSPCGSSGRRVVLLLCPSCLCMPCWCCRCAHSDGPHRGATCGTPSEHAAGHVRTGLHEGGSRRVRPLSVWARHVAVLALRNAWRRGVREGERDVLTRPRYPWHLVVAHLAAGDSCTCVCVVRGSRRLCHRKDGWGSRWRRCRRRPTRLSCRRG